MKLSVKILLCVYFILTFCNLPKIVFSQTVNLISGKVKDESSSPVESAEIIIHELSLSAYTDKSGQFEFKNIIPGYYNLICLKTGYKNANVYSGYITSDTSFVITMQKSLIETPIIDVTSSFKSSDISNNPFSISIIESRTLSKNRSSNIASTVQYIPGVNNLSTGNSIGKPVLRGLTNQSVLVVHDGIKHESQLWGDEHGPEIPLFNIEKIEILRGPVSLLYGSDGLGGVINIITKPLQYSPNRNPVYFGNLDLNGFSNNTEGAGNLYFGSGSQKLSVSGFTGIRKSNDISTPEGSLSINTPDGIRKIEGGKLFNSGNKEFQFGVNLGYKEKTWNLNATYESFKRELQIHEDPVIDPPATPNQSILTNNFELKGNLKLNKKFDLENLFSYEHQSRIEYESESDKNLGIEALNLDLSVIQADIKLHNRINNELSGTSGSTLTFHSNESLAEEKLIPNYNSSGIGVYVLEKYIKEHISLSGGIRYDYQNLNIHQTEFEKNIVYPQKFNFMSFSGSIGTVYKPVDYFDVYLNFGSGWRPPSEYEMFVNGVHEGSGRFEIGLVTQNKDYSPSSEKSINLDLGFRLRLKNINVEFSAFRNRVNNFIYPAPTGTIDSSSGLPVYLISQDKSTFTGYEYNIQIQPLSWMLFTFSGDYVKTKNEATGNYLPYTPPSKNLMELRLQKSTNGKFQNLYLNINTKLVSEADKTDPLETSTPGYHLLGAGAGFDFLFSESIVSVDFSISNLLDAQYTDHLSRYRYYAMNPGRSFNLKFSIPFTISKK